MREEEKTDGHQDTATDQKDATDPTKGLLRWSLIVGAIGFLILIVVSVYHPHLTERVKFLVGSSLSLFVLLAVIVQAVIYRGQWKAMQEQRTVMGDQLKTMRDSLAQNQQAMEKSWLFATAQGIATCEQLIAMRDQTLVFRGQVAAMNSQLELMREAQKSLAIGERAYLIIEDVVFAEKGSHPRIIYTLYNGGRTPAFNVYSETEASLGTEPLADKMHALGHPHGDKVDMPAGTRKLVQGTHPNFTMKNDHWRQINAGLLTFFVRGVFRYTDFQDIARTLPFSVGWDVSLNRFAHYRTEDYSENPN